MGLSLDLCLVQPTQDLAVVRRKSHQHLWTLSAHRHQADRRFGICLSLCGVEERDGIGLSFEAGWSEEIQVRNDRQRRLWEILRVVSIPTTLTVVDTAGC